MICSTTASEWHDRHHALYLPLQPSNPPTLQSPSWTPWTWLEPGLQRDLKLSSATTRLETGMSTREPASNLPATCAALPFGNNPSLYLAEAEGSGLRQRELISGLSSLCPSASAEKSLNTWGCARGTNLFARPELCPKLSKQRGSLPDAAFDELLKGRLVRDTWAEPLPNEHTTAGQVSASP
ncbi:hypothetical protein MY8738_006167 [Beauveria namnaoensis]